MAVITVEKLKMIIQSMLASVTRYKPNLEVEDPEDPRYVAGKLPVKKLPQIPGSKIKSVPVQKVEGLSTVATSGSYNDLSNKPTIPTVPGDTVRYNISQSLTDAQKKTARTNIGAGDGTYANLTGAPTLAKVATSGSYTDLLMKPTIPTNVVKYESQYLNSSEKLQARQNIGADDYNNLDNKPCYKIPVLTEIDSFTGSLVSGKYYKGKNNPGYALEAGKEYAVKFNGVTYYQIAREKKGGVYTYVVLGNPSQATGDVTGGDELEGATGPFCINMRTDQSLIEMHSPVSGTAILYDISYDVKLVPQELLGADPAPYKQLVTDASGKTVWEDRLAFKMAGKGELIADLGTLEFAGSDGWYTVYKTVSGYQDYEKLVVVWDGVEYVCAGGKFYIGNWAHYNPDGENTGEPFLYHPGEFGWGTTQPGSHSIAVYAYAETLKPIAPEYIGGWKALGEGEPVEREIVASQVLTYADIGDGSGNGMVEVPFALDLRNGSTYKVTWDGTEYESVAYVVQQMTCIGSGDFLGLTGYGNNEPYFFYSGNGMSGSACRGVGEHTVKIVSTLSDIIPCPREYLPENLCESVVVDFRKPITIDEASVLYNNAISGKALFYTRNGIEYYPMSRISGDPTTYLNLHITQNEYWVYEPKDGVYNWEERDLQYDGLITTHYTIAEPNLFGGVHVTGTAIPGIGGGRSVTVTTLAQSTYDTISIENEMYFSLKNLVLQSSTDGSSKKFLIKVDDSGTLSATEVT